MRAERGEVFADRYELIDLLAVGGMGEVWRGTDRVLGRAVAIKLLRSDEVTDPMFLARFRNEARHAAALSHPGIATVFDYGEQHGRAFLVMELVDGEPLSTRLARSGPVPPEVVVDVLGQVGDALAVAHQAGIIHRDVKPGNILLTRQGRVKLTDFGIAKAMGSSTLTASGTVVGTAQYLSPEQATGGAVSASSDVYALGIVAFEMLAGRPPFVGDGPVAVALAQVRDAPPPLPVTVPPPLTALVRDSLAKDPARRPADGAEFAARLRAGVQDGAGLSTTLDPRPSAVPTRLDIGDPISAHRNRRRAELFAIVLCAVLLLSGGAVLARVILGDDASPATTVVPVATPAPTTTAALTVVPATTITTAAPTTTTTAAPTTTLPIVEIVEIVADDIVGRRADDIVEELEDVGLVVIVKPVESEPRERDRVISVEPTGLLPAGTEVTIEVGARRDDDDD